ncbi:MAG: T9SS type A sorting domain-containing protein [candidate division WOR-3 bacterium]
MQKLTVLGLALLMGLALATEKWLSGSATHHIMIQDPQPAVYPPSLGLIDFGIDTFRYDDNTPASAWAWNQGNNGWGMKFISPADNITLTGAMLHFHASWPAPGGTRAMVRVYADDGPGGSPGTEIWHSDTLNINRGVWNFIPINEPIVGSNYYIFYIQVDSYPRCPGLSIDAYENAPSHRSWTYMAGNFAEDANRGDWAIRAVVDWTPQDVNAELRYFATNMPRDTVPNINFQVRVMIRNLGNNALPQGTPLKLYITGPQGYTYEGNASTTAALQRGQAQQVNFTSWRIPATSGLYRINVWSEAAGEQWQANDTITYDLSVARWIEYANYNNLSYLVWPGPERATQFDPADFGVQYPVGLSRVRSQFYLHPQYPWNDTTFSFKIYGDDGITLLYESDPIEAPVGAPGPICACDLDSMLIFTAGTFYVSVAPVSGGHPSTCTDDSSDGHSFYGSAGNWTLWTQSGEFFISASVQGGVGVEEGYNPRLRYPTLTLEQSSNPASRMLTVRWQAPRPGSATVDLFDATGRHVENLYRASSSRSGRFSVDLNRFAAGFYFVRLQTESGTVTHKLVIGQ